MRRWQPRTPAGKFLVLQLAGVALVLPPDGEATGAVLTAVLGRRTGGPTSPSGDQVRVETA